MNMLKKLKNDDFLKAVDDLQVQLQTQLDYWSHNPIQKRAAELELESLHRLVRDERMLEVWQKVLNPDSSKGIALLHSAYRLRGDWYFLTYKEIKDKKYYKDRLSQYENLKNKLLKFLKTEIYEGDYETLKSSLEDIDRYFDPPRANNQAVYRKLPKKMHADSAENVYLQMSLVEEMLVELRQPNYRLVAIIVDVLLDNENMTDVSAVQHNTSEIAKSLPKGNLKI